MLNSSTIQDPYLLVNSEGLVEFLAKEIVTEAWGFSIDVQDLYYSLPHGPLMNCVYDCITKDNDEVVFRNTCGMTVESFLELLDYYLNDTHVGFCGDTFFKPKVSA